MGTTSRARAADGRRLCSLEAFLAVDRELAGGAPLAGAVADDNAGVATTLRRQNSEHLQELTGRPADMDGASQDLPPAEPAPALTSLVSEMTRHFNEQLSNFQGKICAERQELKHQSSELRKDIEELFCRTKREVPLRGLPPNARASKFDIY